MSKQPQLVDALTVTLTGKDSPAVALDSFVKVVAAMRILLNELGKDSHLKWNITKANLNSPLFLTIESPISDERDRRVLNDYLSFFRTIPATASVNAVNQVRTIANVVNANGVSHVAFDSPGRESVIVWPRQSKEMPKVKQEVPLSEYSCHVALTGLLEIASTEHGERAFYVKDRIKHNKVRCECTEANFVMALEAMKKSQSPRVMVKGRAYYRGNQPYRMKVEQMEVLPSLEDHPGLFAVQGIDITGGMDSVAYVRSLRDGD